MEVKRCPWPHIADPAYEDYHDHEWGKLNLDEHYLYQMLVLESFQAGLSWLTILRKRENFKQAFANFDYDQVAKFDGQKVSQLMQDEGIIRNQLKINAAVNNAQVMVKLHQSGQTLADLLKEEVPKVIVNHPQAVTDIPAKTPLSAKISKELKKAGFKFVGPVTVYSFLQAVGLINDHLEDCYFKFK